MYSLECDCKDEMKFLFVAALVWQLMKAYTLSMLTKLAGTGHPIVEKEIIAWVNEKVRMHSIISMDQSITQ